MRAEMKVWTCQASDRDSETLKGDQDSSVEGEAEVCRGRDIAVVGIKTWQKREVVKGRCLINFAVLQNAASTFITLQTISKILYYL